MALPRALKLMLGTIGGAGVLLGLSGGAFAADGGQGTTSQDITGSVIQQNNTASSVDEKINSANAVVASDKVGGGGQGGSTSEVSPVGGKDNSVSGPAPATDTAAVSKGGTTPELAASSTITQPANGTSVVPAQQLVTAGVPAISQDTSRSAGLTQVVPAEASVVYHSMRLAIGPKITTMTSQANDLASMIPTAPAQQQNPSIPVAPVIPGGLFSAFATKLASTVVPSVITVPNWGFTGFATAIYILASLLVLISGFAVSEFGSWTRRGGYAHAARSDVPAAIINTFFATPHRLGYVLAFAPLRSPFLMVSDTKIVFLTVPNAYRKEEMR